jgi:glutaredoxin
VDRRSRPPRNCAPPRPCDPGQRRFGGAGAGRRDAPRRGHRRRPHLRRRAGAFTDTNKPAEVPEEARGLVRVTLLAGPEPPPGRVWVANLRGPASAAGWPLSTVERGLFEELALGQGRSSQVELPAGLEPPVAAPREADVIVYKTDWCGVCKQLTAYLDRKGVKYVAKDIEKDSAAAGELRAKAEKSGVKTGSVPVVDVRGELMVGFDRSRLEQLL